MKLFRHKKFINDWNKARLIDKQFNLFMLYGGYLQQEKPLPAESRDHALIGGQYPKCREFHLGGDMLVIYRVDREKEEMAFIRLGTHSQLFK
jgi:mRNA interferase YafQ